jgi:hypothetical protein
MRLRTRIHLWKIRRDLRKAGAQYHRILQKSGKKEDDCTGEDWYLDWMVANVSADSDEMATVSNELVDQARRLYLPTPAYDDKEAWDQDYGNPPTRFLTAKAMTELRASVRKERAERRAVAESWLKVLGGIFGILTGLLGALIGLIAILKK